MGLYEQVEVIVIMLLMFMQAFDATVVDMQEIGRKSISEF
jgi:hypothetical protein